MKKNTENNVGKTHEELRKEIADLKVEIAKMRLEKKGTQQKDTNIISKKRRKLAVLLTFLRKTKDQI